MTLLFVILLDVGVILVVSAFEGPQATIKSTFSDILNNTIRPASDTGAASPASTTQPTATSTSSTGGNNVSISAPIIRRP